MVDKELQFTDCSDLRCEAVVMSKATWALVKKKGKALQDELAAKLEQAHGLDRIFYDGMVKMGTIDVKNDGFEEVYLREQPNKQTAIEKAFGIFESAVHSHAVRDVGSRYPTVAKGVCWSVMPEICTRQRSREVKFGVHKNYGDPFWCLYMRFKLL